MKCNSKQVRKYKANKVREQRKREREEYLATLTDEEREQFFKDEKKRQENSLRIFNSLVNACSTMGVKKYYK